MSNNRMKVIKGEIDPILTEICRGYRNSGYICDEIFPVVTVPTETGKIPMFGKEEFQSFNTLRALRAPSNETSMEGIAWESYSMEEYDLAQRLDYREIAEPNQVLQVDTMAAQRVQNALDLDRELRAASIAQNPNTYTANHRLSRTAGTYFSDVSIDFLNEIQKSKELMKNDIGIYPNTLTIPQKVWAKLKFHPKLKAYIVNLPGTDAMAAVADLAKLLEFDKVLIGEAVYTQDKVTFLPVWGNNIMLNYIAPPTPLGRSPYDPSFGYTLRQSTYPYADRYSESGDKINFVRSTDKYAIKVVGAESGLIIQNPIDPAVYAL